MKRECEGRVASIFPTPKSLYVHVPFCRHRCGYCNFSVLAGRDDLQSAMVDALIDELGRIELSGSPPAIQTLFLGGGTPTHLCDRDLGRLVESIRERFLIDPAAEWSIEANPEDISVSRLQLLDSLGVNRISLGVQSFDSSKLQVLQRSHNGMDAHSAIDSCCRIIGNVSIDLIFGVPGESLDVWKRDLTNASQTDITHISTYSLTFEKGTRFWNDRQRGRLSSPDESLEIEMIQTATSILSDVRLDRYEISSYARSGYRCRHNQAYWAGEGWFAVGPGAARFVDGLREVNHRSPTTYLKLVQNGQCPTVESEKVSPTQYARELAAFGVRQIEGVDLKDIEYRTQFPLIEQMEAPIQKWLQRNWVTFNGTKIRLTESGRLFADSVASDFLS